VVFALYGDVAGSQTSEDRLASDFAEPGVDPFVELVFSTSTGVFRVTRSPRHERDKRRGSGRTTVNARATLTKLQAVDDVAGQSLGTGVADVNVQIQQAIGLSQQQFVQTVVLPQGEFATFLQSDADQRRDLLQRLFGTQVYSRVQSVLEQRRRDAKERLRGADHAVGTALAVFLAAARDDAVADPTADPPGHPVEPMALERVAAEPGQDALVETALAERLAELEHQRGRCAEHHERSRALTSAQRVALEELSRRHELAATKRGLLADQERLGEDRDVDARNRERLGAAQRHETVRGVLEDLADAERGLADAVEALAAAGAQPAH
jgi:exonuclease SbcC